MGPLAPRWAHVQGVAAAAELMAAGLAPIDADAVVAAAWLHDVGYAPSVLSTSFHPVDGAAFVRANGFLPWWYHSLRLDRGTAVGPVVGGHRHCGQSSRG